MMLIFVIIIRNAIHLALYEHSKIYTGFGDQSKAQLEFGVSSADIVDIFNRRNIFNC